ncbi:MAG: S8 family serine peptidase, partial [Chitinophagales bacterium]
NVQQVMGEEAWDITTGESTVVIGLVDDAVMVEHSDLADNMWVNAGEIAGNGIDDDGNGYIDDINGWDAADDDNNPSPPTASADDNTFSHGTHCAGIASAVTDNSNGIAGMGFNTTIMGVKCTPDSQPGGAIPAAMEGVEYAVAAGADVISMSWGGGPESATDQAVFDAAHD